MMQNQLKSGLRDKYIILITEQVQLFKKLFKCLILIEHAYVENIKINGTNCNAQDAHFDK